MSKKTKPTSVMDIPAFREIREKLNDVSAELREVREKISRKSAERSTLAPPRVNRVQAEAMALIGAGTAVAEEWTRLAELDTELADLRKREQVLEAASKLASDKLREVESIAARELRAAYADEQRERALAVFQAGRALLESLQAAEDFESRLGCDWGAPWITWRHPIVGGGRDRFERMRLYLSELATELKTDDKFD